MRYRILRYVLLAFVVGFFQVASALDTSEPVVANFIDKMHRSHGFDRNNLQKLFLKVNKNESILRLIQKPAEKELSWQRYRKILISKKRIEGGVHFWQTHRQVLQEAYEEYGVPPQLVAAIIGVETSYGKNKGNLSVLEALSTIGFYYPKRSKFFLSELEAFLLLCQKKNIDPAVPQGSYAGAMGWPQFMPSSYTGYAVAHDTQAQYPDIWDTPADVIFSIGSYFRGRGQWEPGAPTASKVEPTSALDGATDTKPRSRRTKKILKQNWLTRTKATKAKQNAGVVKRTDLPSHLVKFSYGKDQQHTDYWLLYPNFYAIMKYNTSAFYAMAVYQLSQEIKRTYEARQLPQSG